MVYAKCAFSHFAKYGLGVMLYYHSIKNLIERGIKRVYLGGGHYDYKKNSKAKITSTSSIEPSSATIDIIFFSIS